MTTAGQQPRPRTLSPDSATGAESVMGMHGWQQPGVSTSPLLRLLQEVKSDDLERDIIKHACSGFGSSQHAFEPRHQPDLSGHVVEVENGKVAVLVRWFRGAPETVMVFKKGNVKRKAIVDALTHIAAGVKTRCTR